MNNASATLPATNTSNNIVTDSNKIGSLEYCIGVSVGITLFIATISLVSYYCTRDSLQQQQPSRTRESRDPISRIWNARSMPPDENHVVLAVDTGLDETTIAGFPKLRYSEVKQLMGTEESAVALCCSICLSDYKANDDLRLLPDCGHLFHHKCIDPWLRSHPTCPVCRTSPIPIPVSMEVMPRSS